MKSPVYAKFTRDLEFYVTEDDVVNRFRKSKFGFVANLGVTERISQKVREKFPTERLVVPTSER